MSVEPGSCLPGAGGSRSAVRGGAPNGLAVATPQSPAPGAGAPAARLRVELQRASLAADRRGVIAALLASGIAGWVLEQHGAGAGAWRWAAACAVLVGLRGVLVAVAGRGGTRAASATTSAGAGAAGGGAAAPPVPSAWLERAWLAAVAAAAIAWGAGPLLFAPAELGTGALQAGIWLATAGVAAPLLAASRPAIYLWLVPALGPLVLALALSATVGGWVLALLAGAFLVMLLRISLEQNTLLRGAIGARLRNEDLVEQLRTQVEIAARASQEKTRFLASAAHDLRQPLHALGLFCAALDQRLRDIPERPLIRNMMNAIESLEASFGAMLDISRLDAGVVQAASQAFPIRDLFRRLYQQFGGDAEARDLSLRFRAARRIVVSDPLLLERVLGNLVQNALRYTRRGGVLVAARRHPDGLALEVWDTGAGIAPDQLELIFEEFYQVENPERDRARGLGMGLAIVRRLCRLLDHRLEVRSRPGRGTLFRVIAPAGDLADVAPPLEADTLPPRERPRLRLLLIDDERAIREATRELLRPLGVEVVAAGGIAEALAAVRAAGEPFDLVMSDWRLRGDENGIDAVRAVRQLCGAGTPAVLVTGDTSPELPARAMENGLVILHKPLQPRELIRLIARFGRRSETAPGAADRAG